MSFKEITKGLGTHGTKGENLYESRKVVDCDRRNGVLLAILGDAALFILAPLKSGCDD